jgi:hypothetical protein
MDAATREAFNNLRVHALEARDAVAAINAKINELKNEGAVSSALEPLRRELLNAQDEVRRTEAAVREFGKISEESLLSARESGRLLTEELGVHMPRAVTGAVGEMLPEIAALGPALLGVFAVKEVWDFGKAAIDMLHDMQGETEQLAEDWKRVKEEQEKILTHPEDRAQAEARIRDTLREQAEVNARIRELKKEMAEEDSKMRLDLDEGLVAHYQINSQLKEQEALERTLQDRLVEQQEALRKLTSEQTGYNLEVKKAQDAAAEVSASRGQRLKTELSELQGELDLELQKAGQNEDKKEELRKVYAARRLKLEREFTVEVQREEKKRAGNSTDLYAHAAEEDEKLLKRMQQWHEEWLKAIGMPEEVKFSLQEITREINSAGLAAAKSLPSLTAMGESVKQLTAAQRAALPTDEQIKKVYEDLLKLRPNLTLAEAKALAQQLAAVPAIAAVTRETGNQKTVTEQLTAAILKQLMAEGKLTEQHAKQVAAANGVDLENKKLIVGLQQLKEVEEAFGRSAKDGLQAILAETEALQEIGEEVGALVKSRKIQAEIEGSFDAAKAIEELAIFIASKGTDTSALLASVKYSLASAEYFKVAGSGSGSSAGGAGGGSSASMQGGQTGPQAPGAIGTEVPITPGFTSVGGGGVNITVHVYGPNQEASHIASVLTNYTTRKGGSLVASRSLSPPRAGR